MFVVVGATGNTGASVAKTLLGNKSATNRRSGSSVGGHMAGETGPIRAASYGEHALEAAVKNITILRPSYFMENWAPVIGAAKAQGVLPTFIAPQAKIPMTSTEDIGRIGAEHLMAGGSGKQMVEMAGPSEYSPDEVASACPSKRRGSDVQIVWVFRRSGKIVRRNVYRFLKRRNRIRASGQGGAGYGYAA